MKIKKLLLAFILVIVLVACVGCEGLFSTCNHADTNGDGICDLCLKNIPCVKHVDDDGNNLCDKCGEAIAPPPCTTHVDQNGDKLCDVCGESLATVCSHDFRGDYLSDQSGHWKECLICGTQSSKQSHEESEDGNCMTAVVCSCGYEILSGKDQHVDADNDGFCDNKGCKEPVTPACTEHDFSQSKWLSDGVSHWKKCANCSSTTTKEDHSVVDNRATDCTSDAVCSICSYVKVDGVDAHDFTSGSLVQLDNNQHATKCANCTVTDRAENCSVASAYKGDCTVDVKCACGRVTLPKTTHNYVGATWQQDQNGHWRVCQNQGCNVAETSQPHVDEDTNGSCDYCKHSVTIPSSCVHTDTDDNGECDKCAEPVTENIDLFAVNDLHGKFSYVDESQPGVGKLTSYLLEQKQNNDNTIFISSGDMWQGSAESGLTKCNIMTDWMNTVGFSLMTIGNHEFDWGDTHISKNADIANFPFLAINIIDNRTNSIASFCQASTVVDLGNVQVGFIGAISNCKSSILGTMVSNYDFVTGTALTTLVTNEAARLREEESADIIVYVIHGGADKEYISNGTIDDSYESQMGDYYDMALSRNEVVDIVFEAHTHQNYIDVDSAGVYHVQTNGYNASLINAKIVYNTANGNVTVNTPSNVDSSTYAGYQTHDIEAELLVKYADELEIMSKVFGTLSSTLGSTKIKQLVAQTYASLATTKWSNYNVVLGGGYITARSPYNFYAGDVTYAQIFEVLPFDNRLCLCTIDGATLKSQFINSTNSNYYISFTEYGNSATIDDNSRYYIIVDEYSLAYKKNNLTLVEFYDNETYARDLIAQYLQTNYPSGGTTITPTVTLKPDEYNSIADLLAVGATLPDDTPTTDWYYLTGKITSITSTTHGNMYIEDDFGNSIYIYGFYSLTGSTRYDAMTTKPQVGDTISVYGVLVNYRGTVEIKNARWVSE